jgi:hypothetical protein
VGFEPGRFCDNQHTLFDLDVRVFDEILLTFERDRIGLLWFDEDLIWAIDGDLIEVGDLNGSRHDFA